MVARLWFEGNRFAPGRTGLADFQRVEWARGEAARRRPQNGARRAQSAAPPIVGAPPGRVKAASPRHVRIAARVGIM